MTINPNNNKATINNSLVPKNHNKKAINKSNKPKDNKPINNNKLNNNKLSKEYITPHKEIELECHMIMNKIKDKNGVMISSME